MKKNDLIAALADKGFSPQDIAMVLDAAKPVPAPSFRSGDADLVAAGVPESDLEAWKAVRRRKRAPAISKAIAKTLISEAEKAGITAHEAITICIQRGWQGFRAEWVDKPCKPLDRQARGYAGVLLALHRVH